MQLKSTTVIFTFASSLMASPFGTAPTASSLVPAPLGTAPTEVDRLLELARERAQISKGDLIYLGGSAGTANATASTLPEPRSIGKRASSCPQRETKCSTSHAARNANCDALVTELGGDSGTKVVANTRQICYKGDSSKNEKCCVSTSEVIANLVKGDLVNAANTLLQTCTESGISGKMTNVLMGGVCGSVCLSNHEAWCF